MIEVARLHLQQGNFSLRDVALHVPEGKYAMLMGKTGCGKTTILEAIAGLRLLKSGRVLLNGRDVTFAAPAERHIGYVPQDGSLFRTMTVRDNLAFALTIRKCSTGAIKERVGQLASWLHLEHLLERRAVGLSGGETQRIALGRALANRPPILLMDEPLSSLDEETREKMVEVLREMRKHERITVLHVTHSSQEAGRLGDMIFKLLDGRVVPLCSADGSESGEDPIKTHWPVDHQPE